MYEAEIPPLGEYSDNLATLPDIAAYETQVDLKGCAQFIGRGALFARPPCA